ncbi:MAG TPA: uracil-DNA glycosylase [bacterium]|jgi:hypothetical protein
MIPQDLWRLITRHVFAYPSSATLFNPYAACHAGADRADACAIRRKNLRGYLSSFPEPPGILLVGEASGPWGCRFSGVPFTSERQLCSGELPFAGRQSSTHDEPHHERTAGIFWDVMARHHPRCFIWNAVPLHPHPAGEPFSLRRPSRSDVKAFAELLNGLVERLAPAQIIAVGRIAQRAVQDVGQTPVYVRHPSHGGMREFRTGIDRILCT